MRRTRRDRWLLPLPLGIAIGAALGSGIVRYIVDGGLSWGDAGSIAVTFIIQYAVAFAVARFFYGPVKPTKPGDTNDDAG